MEKNLGGSRVDNSKTQIINVFLGKLKNKEISTKEDFKELYERTVKYSKQLDIEEDYNALRVFWEKIEELEENGMAREEILSLVPEETKEIVEENFKIRDLLELEPIEVLKKIEDPESDMYEMINDSVFGEYYSERVTQRIFRGITNKELSGSLFREIRYGLGSYILENGLNVDTLGIETVDLDRSRGITINLYNATGDEVEYVATLSSASEEGNFEAFRVCSNEERKKLLEENRELTPDGVILNSESGSILEYTGGNEYTFIDENGDVYENYGEVNYHKSYAEDVYSRTRSSAKRYMNLQRMGAPYQILEKELKLMNDLKSEHAEITKRKGKFTPKDVEKATEEITLDDVQKIIDEMTGPKNTKEESLEKGIGFDEH